MGFEPTTSSVHSSSARVPPQLLDPFKGRGAVLGQADPTYVTYGYNAWSLSADGKKIAALAGSDSSRIQVIDVNGKPTDVINLAGWHLQSVSWAPHNQRLYVSGQTGQSFKILLVRLDGGFKSLSEFPMGRGWPFAPKPSPDGRYLAYYLRLFEENVALLENY